MRIKGLKDEDFINYQDASMFIITATCTFKCDIEWGSQCCQNTSQAKAPVLDIDDNEIIRRYINNPITKSIVFGGLEPLDQIEELYNFIYKLRYDFLCNDTVVIYTGYYPEEVERQIEQLKTIPNIIVKFGRFIPDQPLHFDKVLGINLASINQFGVRIS